MYMLRRRTVHMPAREKIVRFALAEKRGVNHKKKTEPIATLLILAECRKEDLLWHDDTYGLYILCDFFKCRTRFLERLARANRVKSGRFDLTNTLASDARTVSDCLKCLALRVAPQAETADKDFTGTLRRCRKKPFYEYSAIKGKRGSRGGFRLCLLCGLGSLVHVV